MSEKQSVLLFGCTGCGKSSIANMLVQGDIYQNNNVFTINNSAKGETLNIHANCSEKYQVFDVFDTVSPYHITEIRNYFASRKLSLNYLFYVQEKGRICNEDKKRFKLFREIFQCGEKNFVIIITNSKPEWVEKNLEAITESFGKYPIISVDFPLTDEDNDTADDTTCKDKNKRVQSLQRLENKLLELNYKSIKLEVLSPTQKTEKNVSRVVGNIPVVGTAYQLISSGVYYTLEKPNNAKERLIDGTVGLALDAMGVSFASNLPAALFKDVLGRITYEACKEIQKETKDKFFSSSK